MINTSMLNPNHQIYLSFSSLFLYHNNQKMFYKKGEKCNVEGCCTPSKRYCAPESPFLQQSQEDKPDAKYPRLWQEVYHAIYYLPYSLLIFFHDLYSHSILRKPTRPTWGITTTFTIAVVHVIRCIFQESSLSLWRASLRLPSKLSKSMDKYHSAPFVAKRLNLPVFSRILTLGKMERVKLRLIGCSLLLLLKRRSMEMRVYHRKRAREDYTIFSWWTVLCQGLACLFKQISEIVCIYKVECVL